MCNIPNEIKEVNKKGGEKNYSSTGTM